MKKLLSLSIVCVALISTSSYSQSKVVTVNGSVSDSTLNGKTAYLTDYNSNNKIDSCVVANNSFTLKGDAAISRVYVGRAYANVLADNGTVNVVLGSPSTVSGTPLNELLFAFNTEIKELQKITRPKFQALYSDSTLTKEEKDARYEILNKEYSDKSGALINNAMKGHEQDPLGLYIIWDKFQARNLSVAQMDSLIKVGGELAANFKPFERMRQSVVNKEATMAGKKFVDFEGLNPDGTPAKLSDYVGKGKYVLVDFWASWCGPCKAEVPVIKELYEEYKDKGLVILGANVWDKKEPFEKAVVDLKMPWAQICSFDNTIPTDVYGIDGIPHIILFAPDGTIEDRGLRGEKMKEKIASIFQK